MSTARLVPLWRSTGRCLALRPRSVVAVTAPSASVSAAFSFSFSKQLSTATTPVSARRLLLQRTLLSRASGAVRGYADDASPNPPSPADAAASTSPPPPQSPESPAAASAASTPSPPTPISPADALAKAAVSAGPGLPSADSALPSDDENSAVLLQLAALAEGHAPFDAEVVGHNFGLSTASTRAAILSAGVGAGAGAENQDDALALPVAPPLQERYDPVIHQVTRLIMRDGKLAKAQRDMATILNFLRQSSPPTLNPARPLLRGHLPASQLPLDPAYYLQLAIDSVAPLFKIRNVAGAAGGGRSLPVPTPLALRQRRRTAFMWLLDTVKNKQSRGSGRGQFATRVGEEIVAIAEGRSSLWEKRQLVHKLSTTSRMNAGASGKKKKFQVKVL